MRRRGLGDLVAELLAAIGIHERPGTCGCRTRRAWLNRLDFAGRAWIARLLPLP